MLTDICSGDDDLSTADFIVRNKDYFEVIKGSYFRGGEYNNPEIPVPTREGYEFIGWYRYEKLPTNFNPYIHMPFNDFSVVAEDALHLYAQWKKI